MKPLFDVVFDTDAPRSQIVATAIHAGHDLRPEVRDRMVLDDAVRQREEDPYTDRIATVAPMALVVNRSRFEIDLNRTRAKAVYEQPADAWGLDVWAERLEREIVERSRLLHDEFYAALTEALDLRARAGPFVVLDVHSYNHRRDGRDAPAAAAESNPQVNVGTGSMDRERWGDLVERFMVDLADQRVAGDRIDARENVRFRGGYLTSWVHDRYGGTGCALALEFKKVFMDEWSGAADFDHVDELRVALSNTFPDLASILASRG